jgi:hypothetical protein
MACQLRRQAIEKTAVDQADVDHIAEMNLILITIGKD